MARTKKRDPSAQALVPKHLLIRVMGLLNKCGCLIALQAAAGCLCSSAQAGELMLAIFHGQPSTALICLLAAISLLA
jgi:hypothetical protein